MRFANPPGIAAFMQKNAGYDEIGGRAVKDAVDQDLTTMGTMGQAQSNALATIAQDKAAEYMRDAQAFGMAKQADANMFGSIASGVANLGGAAFQKFGTGGLGIGKGAAFGEVGTSGSDMASFGYTPEQDRLFNSGVGIEWSS